MRIDFSEFFHRSSKDVTGGGTVFIPKDERQWPVEWLTTYYKAYPRLPKIKLTSREPEANFFNLIRTRRSERRFTLGVLDADKLSTLLKYSCGIIEDEPQSNPRRAQPSGGGRYPIEIYPILFRDSGEIPSGVYHYNVKEHALDVLWKRSFSRSDIARLAFYDWVQDASCLLVMTSVFWRTKMKYGERGYRYALIEAGHIGQNVYLTSTALGIPCTALGGAHDTQIEKLIDVDGYDESMVYSMVLG